MFGRFSFSLSRVFRLRRRRSRGAKANGGSTRTARRSTFEPSPSPSTSESCRPALLHLEPIHITPTPSTTQPRSRFTHSLLSPIPQSPITPTRDTLTPILIIGQDPAQQTRPPSTAPALSSDVGSQPHGDGVLPPESQPVPTHSNTRRVSFQLPTTHTEPSEPPESPLSTCSTLVPDVEEAPAEIGSVAPSEQLALEAPDSGSVPAASAEPAAGLDDVVSSESGRTRPVSLLSQQPARVDVSRFSLPVTPTAPTITITTNTREGRKEGKRVSLLSLMSRSGSGPGSTKKEQRSSRWSEELKKPETQEVLRVLSGF